MQIQSSDRVRVTATGRVGTVAYVRFAAPDFRTVEAASVRLDDKWNHRYEGTVFPVAELERIPEEN